MIWDELKDLLHRRIIQLIALGTMLVWAAKNAVDHKYSVRDPDVWWHLKTGDWIIEHFAVPHTGLFSRTVAARPWVAYSWGFEVALSRAYHWFGLMGLGLFGVFLTLAIVYLQFWSLRRLSGRFWVAWLLAASSLYAFVFIINPRPVFVSILLYLVLLTLLLEASRSGRTKTLYWLPIVFVVWANVHIQFVYGLFVLGLFIACQIVLQWANRMNVAPAMLEPPTLPAKPLLIVFAGCVLATLVGPYSYELYKVVYLYSKAKYSYEIIIELQPPSFRIGNNFVQLLLTGAGFLAVGWRKKVNLFKLLLMIAASVLAFRTIRDSWFVCVNAAAFIADLTARDSKRDRGESLAECGVLLAAVAIFLLLLSRNFDFNERALDRTVSAEFPVDAVNYLRRKPLPGPLYNNLDWGGFLIWYMPQMPVAIDGRNDLYGDELDRIFYKAQNAEGYKTDSYFLQAGCILLRRKYPLAAVLRFDPDFVLVYEDPIAMVYARR